MQKKLLHVILVLFACLISCPLWGNGQSAPSSEEGQSLLKAKMLEDLDFLKGFMEVGYAPATWKRTRYGWNLETEMAKAKTRVLGTNPISIKDFQRIVRDFFCTTKDYHVHVSFFSTEHATLPFLVTGAEGRYFFSYIDRDRLSYFAFPFSIGDELLSFDGLPVRTVVEELKTSELTSSHEPTDEALAQTLLTQRFGSSACRVPQGPVTLTVKTQSGKVKSCRVSWEYAPERIANPLSTTDDSFSWPSGSAWSSSSLEMQPRRRATAALQQLFFSKEWLLPCYRERMAFSPKLLQEGHSVGSRKSFLPPLGKKIWQSAEECPYDAYLFETQDRTLVGYVRIPHYLMEDEEAVAFSRIIDRFQATTDLLVIDQFDNPGGYFFHAFALTSMLTDRPLSVPKECVKISQSDINAALSLLELLDAVENDGQAQEILGEKIQGYPVTFQFAQSLRGYLQFIVEEWDNGHSLTVPHYWSGADHIAPHPTTRYTKPILMLINELDFSCGDYVPAILQDNHRVTLFGARTAGAGGSVYALSYPNRFGIDTIRYTGTIAERQSKHPIENLGVTPDIPYNISVEDLQGGYQNLVQAIREAIDKMLQS